MPLMAAIARERGVRTLLAYPSAGDMPILRASDWCGFEPFALRHERYRFFRRRVSFAPLPDGMTLSAEGRIVEGL